jgi:PAS domain-containing protein
VVEDLSQPNEFAASAEFLRSYGVVAVQSTPIHSQGGKLLGVLSTYFNKPHRPSDREMRLLDLYVQQAERVIERKQADEALRKSEERLALALDASRSGVWDLDLLSNQATVSQSFRVLHRIPADEQLTYAKWMSFLNKQDRRRLIVYGEQLLREGAEFNFEYRVRSGSTRRHRRIFRGRHYQHGSSRHHHQLEPRSRSPLRLQPGGNNRPAGVRGDSERTSS